MQPSTKLFTVFILLVSLLAGVAGAHEILAPQAPTNLSPQAVRDDFDALYAGLKAGHYDLYARRSRAEYDALFNRMRSEIEAPLPALDVWSRFQRFVAYGNVAHARIDPPASAWESYRQRGGKAFPLFLCIVGKKAYVSVDDSAEPGIAPGEELVSVQGQPIMQWLAPMRALVSADNDYLAYTQLETQLPLLIWLSGNRSLPFRVVLRSRDGRRSEYLLPARDRAGFESAAANRAKTFEFDGDTREARVLDKGLAYLRPGPFYDNRPNATDMWDATAFQDFLDRSFEQFIEQDAQRLLIDLRDNPGGDNSFSNRMIAWFADRPFRFSERFDIKISAAATAANLKRLQSQSGGADSTSTKLAAAYAGKPIGDHIDFPIAWTPPRVGKHFKGEVYLLINRHSYSNTVLVAATGAGLSLRQGARRRDRRSRQHLRDSREIHTPQHRT